MRSNSRRLSRLPIVTNQAGNITIATGLVATILFGFVGGAVDYGRMQAAKSRVQTSLDAATLAGGRALQLSETNDLAVAISAATEYFNQSKPGNVDIATTFNVLEGGTSLRGQADMTIQTPLLGVFGWRELRTRIISETVLAAGANAGTNLEVSMMLDMTGSMAGTKIDDLKLAAKDLIDIVVWSDQSQYTSKVALAPFSARVNVGSRLPLVSSVLATKTFKGKTLKGRTCVTDRTGPEAFTDAAPTGQNVVSAYQGDTGTAARDNANNYHSTGFCTVSYNGVSVTVPEIMPLTSDKTALKARIDSLPASGSTAGALGTAWAWYLLSPNWNSVWVGTEQPAPYADLTATGPKGGPKLQKVAVLMTDGVYNTMRATNFGDTSSEATTISNNAVQICNNMKAAGIKIYTVGFQLGGNELATNTLKACASRDPGDPESDPSYFFNAESGSELRSSFRQIALQLSTLRLRQ